MSDFSERIHRYQELEAQILRLHPSLKTRLNNITRIEGALTTVDEALLKHGVINEEEARASKEQLAQALREWEYMSGETDIARAWHHLVSERKARFEGLAVQPPPPPRPTPPAPPPPGPE